MVRIPAQRDVRAVNLDQSLDLRQLATDILRQNRIWPLRELLECQLHCCHCDCWCLAGAAAFSHGGRLGSAKVAADTARNRRMAACQAVHYHSRALFSQTGKAPN